MKFRKEVIKGSNLKVGEIRYVNTDVGKFKVRLVREGIHMWDCVSLQSTYWGSSGQCLTFFTIKFE